MGSALAVGAVLLLARSGTSALAEQPIASRKLALDTVYLVDSSDWWSWGREEENDTSSEHPAASSRGASPQASDVARFTILGTALSDRKQWLRGIEKTLGPVTIVTRGDGASGREQLCYRSTDEAERVNLVFEHNEIFYSYFLFSGGQSWKGEEYCTSSERVSKTLSARGGLRLGLTESEADRILGAPASASKDRRIYEFVTHKIVRKDPLQETEDFEVSGTIKVSFSNHRANYIGVTRSEIW